ncbi:MAG: ArnT family glycosyltransferase [Methylococcales bacterium]
MAVIEPASKPGGTDQTTRSIVPALALLAVIGHAAAVSLIVAPHYAVFQHYIPISQFKEDAPPLGLAILVLQAAIISVLLLRRWRDIVRIALGLGRLPLLFTLGVLLFSAAVPTQSVTRYLGETAVSFGLMVLSIASLALTALALPEAWLRRAVNAIARRITLTNAEATEYFWDRMLPRAAALWTLVVTAGLAILVFERVPHIDDSIAYLFQAKYLSTGVLWLPRPPDPGSFGVAHLIVDGDRWYSKFFPGWPALLALGVLAGVPWLINPLLAAVTVLLVHRFTRAVYGLWTAHATTLLLCVSPWFLFLSASYMAHAASLFWMLLALVAIEQQRGQQVQGWAVLAGSALGMLFLTRPFDAALVGPVIGFSALGVGARRLSIGAIAGLGLSAAAAAGLYFLYNAALTGDPIVVPHRLWADHLFGPGVDVFGFGARVGIPLWRNIDPLPGHGLADVVLNANKNFTLLNFELFGWACGSLVIVALTMRPQWFDRGDMLMLAILIAVIGGHSFYWAPGGPDFGARYWYLIILPLLVLTVRGAERLAKQAARLDGASTVTGARLSAAMVLACLSAIIVVLPWRSIGKYHEYRGIGRAIQRQVDRHGIQDALVFVRTTRRSDYQEAFILNPPSLEDPGNVFAWDLGSIHRGAVLAHYASRPVWLIGRNSETDPLKVIAGPLPPGHDPFGDAPAVPESLQAVLK